MPDEGEFVEGALPDIVDDFENWLNERAVSDKLLTVADLDACFFVMWFRWRSVFTLEELHARLHGMMAYSEHMLRTPENFTDEDGNPVEPIIAEQHRNLGREGLDMLSELSKGISEEDLEALLAEADES